MLRSFAKSGLIVVAALLGVLTITADEPPQHPAEHQIRRALQGEPVGGTASDGILADVLGIISEQGSILDGSSLDETARAQDTAREEKVAVSDRRPSSRNAYAAEQLLKSARVLEKLGKGDADRQALVNGLRAEAVKLLSE